MYLSNLGTALHSLFDRTGDLKVLQDATVTTAGGGSRHLT